MGNNKLELTWIGKDNQPQLEPRILIEDPSKSYGDKNTQNMLIHGDNLLALKALEQDYAGKIKCIYIDPPYNTGNAFEHYDDGLEHSLWLSLMKPRLELLRNLLTEDGSIFVSIDNNEIAYLQVLMDEIFLRKNRKNTIIIKRGSVTGAKVINPGLVNISEFILVYTKNSSKWNPNRLSRKKERDERYSTFIENYESTFSEWRFIPLLQAFALEFGIKNTMLKKHLGDKYEDRLLDFIYKNPERVIRFASLDEKSISKQALEQKKHSLNNLNKTFLMEREGKKPYYIYNGNIILFVKDRLQEIDGDLSFSEALTDIWDDVLPNDLHNEGGVDFRKGKKPEKLIQRILMLASNENDVILDSFLGSGTTASVAHKLNRKWIGIELGEHCDSHCFPRLKKVIEGNDKSGISKGSKWFGGGGFKYYDLAPSLLKQDKYNNWIIDSRYNADMLAASMTKHEGFKYSPDANCYWKQGNSTERDYIFTTTSFITIEHIEKIHDEMKEDESLLICCKSFIDGADKLYNNINIKKIPSMLLGKCEFGREDYSLNIVNMPINEDEPDFVPVGATKKEVKGKIKNSNSNQIGLFSEESDNV